MLHQFYFCQIEDLVVDPNNIERRTTFNRMVSSPEVASFQKINFLPLNLYTGKPDIEIPLYIIKTGDIEVPITLKYDIGGNKVDDIASNVGWGWLLNAGGNITRVVRDIDDHEYETGRQITTPCILTSGGGCDDFDLQYNGYKLLRLGSLRKVADQPITPIAAESYTSNLTEDALPDLFLANAPGLSTKFFLERNFSNYDSSQTYGAKVLDGKKIKFGQIFYGDFETEQIKNYAGFNYQDAAPNLSSSYAGGIDQDNPLYQIRGFQQSSNYSAGLIKSKNNDYRGFDLTNEDGTFYSFKTFDISESTPVFYENESTYWRLDSHILFPNLTHFATAYKINKGAWHLDKIKDLNNKEVKFQYIPSYRFEYDISENYTGLSSVPISEVNKISSLLESGIFFNWIFNMGMSYGNGNIAPINQPIRPINKSSFLSKITQQQLIDKISWDQGDILFHYDIVREDRLNSKALSEIKIVNKSGQIVKHYKFVYSYFKSSEVECSLNNSANCFRLKLDQIYEVDTNNEKISNYFFKYNSENAIPTLNSKSKDYLGYYNAEPNNVDITYSSPYPLITEYFFSPNFTFTPNKGRFSILPFQTNLINSNTSIKIDGQANINPNSFSQAGLLNEIIYPTQGSNKIIYENNKFNLDGIDFIAPGNRVKNQIIDDGNGNVISKHYEYLEADGKSSGTMINFPKIADLLFWNSGTKNLVFSTYSYNKSNIELTQGAYIGYSRVTEKIANKGRTEYYFSSAKEYPNEYELPQTSFFAKHSFYPATSFNDNDNRRGNLKQKIIYDNNTKLIEETYNYASYKILNIYNRNHSISTTARTSTGWFENHKENYNIKLLNSINRLSTKETIEYLNGKLLKKRLDYTYGSNFHPYATEVKNTDSDGNVYSKLIGRVQDLPNQGIFETTMIAKNMVKVPISNISLKNFIKYSENRSTYAPVDSAPEETNTRYLPKYYFSNIGPSVLDISPNSLDKESSIDVYDEKSNVVQYTMKNGIPVTIIWGYNKTLPLAEVNGAKLSDISSNLINNIVTKSNEDNIVGTSLSEQALINELNIFRNHSSMLNYKVITYTYDPLIGLKSKTNSSGLSEFYYYDDANQLKEIRDTDHSIIKEYEYNYVLPTFYNAAKNQSFVKNNCGSGQLPGNSINYSVPANIYTSNISQADADQKARNDININGQAYANANGSCYDAFCQFNAQISSNFFMLQYAPFEKVNNTVNAQIYFQITANPGLNWSDGVLIGYIPSPCWPTATISKTSGNWQVTIYQGSGQTVLRWTGSGNPSTGIPYNIAFNYNVN